MAMGKVTKSFKVTLDIARSISNREFSVVEGDTGNTLSITLNDDGKAVDLTGCRVLALFSKSNGETVCQDSAEQNGGVTIGGQSMNEISIELFVRRFVAENFFDEHFAQWDRKLVNQPDRCQRFLPNG